MDFQEWLSTPLYIRGKSITGRLMLSPMAGLTHTALRRLVAEYGGASLLFTEMCAARGLPNENPEVSRVFRWHTQELDSLICQIVGSDPDHMAMAAARIEKEGFRGVDINMGCSAALVYKKGAGAALLENPARAFKIVESVRKKVSIPVSVKFRMVKGQKIEDLLSFARGLEAAGADMLVFHPRIAPDRRTRPPKWEFIKSVKEAVSVPVIGNGDVFSFESAKRMYLDTGCDGIAVGRLAVARSWIFAAWRGLISGVPCIENMLALGGKRCIQASPYDSQKVYSQPVAALFHETAIKMAQYLSDDFGMDEARKRFLVWIPYFAANFKFGNTLFNRVRKAGSMEEMLMEVDLFIAKRPEVLPIPNRNFFW